MVRLNREQILGAADDLKRVPIEVKAWGGTFYIHEFTAAQHDAWEQAIVANRENMRAITVVHSLFDESGERVFQDADADALGGKRGIGRILNKIAVKARRLNRLDAEDLEEEKGNSEPDRSDASASD